MKLLLLLTLLLLAGCSERPAWRDDPKVIATLSPAGQFAVLADDQLGLAAFALILIGTGLLSGITVKIKHKYPTKDDTP